MKRILLIEDHQKHADFTKFVLKRLIDMYSVECYTVAFVPQNGETRESACKQISDYITTKLANDSFDILMIDMLLGCDSSENPLGLQIIQDMETILRDKSIIVYTEMAAGDLDLIKTYNKSINNRLKLVIKPDLQVLTNKVDCVGGERKKLLESKNIMCNSGKRCTCEEKFLCDMKAIYYELETAI